MNGIGPANTEAGGRGENDPPEVRNKLVAEFPREIRERLARQSEFVFHRAGEVICEPGRSPRHIFFPISGVLSSVIMLKDGTTVESATIGNEGVAGIVSVDVPRTIPTRVMQRMEGESMCVAAEAVWEALAENSVARGIVGRYVLTLFQQSAQNVACNLHHQLEERLCRWLVTTADRAGRSEFRVTQEFLSEMLGVSRQSVNAIAGNLQGRGLISYSRGRLSIMDRPALEARACECYESVRQAFRRLTQAA